MTCPTGRPGGSRVATALSRVGDAVARQLAQPLTRNSLYIFAGSVAGALLGLLFWGIAARFWAPADLGIAVALTSSATLVATLSLVGLETSLIRFVGSRGDRNGVFNTTFTAVGGLALLFGSGFALVGTWAIASPLTDPFRASPAIAVLFVVGSVGYAGFIVSRNAFIAQRSARFVLFQSLVLNAGRIPLLAALAVTFPLVGAFSAWVLAALAAVAASFLLFLPRAAPGFALRPHWDGEHLRASLSFAAGNYVVNVLRMGVPLILPVVAVHLLSPEEAAYFYIAWVLTSPLLVLPESFSLSLLAEGSHETRGVRSKILRTLVITGAVLLPAVLVLALAGRPLLGLFGPSYAEAAYGGLLLLGVATLFGGVNLVGAAVLRLGLRTRALVTQNLVAAAVLAVLAPVLIGRGFGLEGLAGAYLAGQVAAGLVAAVQIVRVVRSAHPRSGLP